MRSKSYNPEDKDDALFNIMVAASESIERDAWIRFTAESLDCMEQHELDEIIRNNGLKPTGYVEEGNNLSSLTRLIIEWAKERGIIPNGNILTQSIKTLEEVHELIRAINREDKDEIIDAYGDIVVTLVIGTYLNDTPLEDCVASAYKTIQHRTGTLNSNGDFIRDKDE